LLFFNPVLLLWAFLGREKLLRSRVLFAFGIGLTGVLIGLVGSVEHPSYGLSLSWGPRYLCPVIPVLALAILPAVDEAFMSRRAVRLIIGLSAALNGSLLLVYFLPGPFEGIRFLLGRGVEVILSTGGLSVPGQLKALHGIPIPALLVFLANAAVLVFPWGLWGWQKHQRERVG